APREVVAPRGEAPLVDGRLDDPCWQGGAWSGEFTVLDLPERQAPVQTAFKVRHDGRRLFVTARLDEPRLGEVVAKVTERDGKVYNDDALEVTIDSDADQVDHFHFAVNSLGTVFDSHVRQGGQVRTTEWNAAVEAKASRGEGFWSVELAVPLADLALNGHSRGAWGFNVARERQAGGQTELSTYAPLTAGFHQPSQFARLTLEQADLERYLWQIKSPYGREVSEADGGLRLTARTYLLNQTGRFRFFRLTASLRGAGGESSQAVTNGLDAEQGKELTLMVPLKAPGPQVLTLTLSDRASGETWAVHQDVVELSYTPLALTLTSPSYRNTVYATQRLTKVAGRVACGLPVEALAGKRLEITLCQGTAGLGSVAVTKVERETAFSLPLPALPPGAYEIRAELRAGQETLHRASAPLRVVPPSAVETRLDERGVLTINGRPTLVFGWFSTPPEEYAAIREQGCNALVDYNAQWRQPEEQKKLLDEVQAAGLKVTFYPYPKPAMLRDDAFAKPLSPEEALLLRENVRRWKDHPAVLAWYLADEPELRPALPQRLQQIYELIAEEDPYHPCIMLNDSMTGVRKYAFAADILMPDPYPLFLKNGLAARGLEYTTQFMKTVAESTGGWRGAWVTPQAFNYGDYGRLNNRAPTLTELRNQWYQAVVAGATGALWYTWSHVANYSHLRLGMPFLARESRLLEPWILALGSGGAVPFAPEEAPLHTALRQVDGVPVLFAVSTGTTPLEAELSLPAGSGSAWHVISEGRQVTARDGKLRDRFEPYAVHLYTLDAALAGRP
ncbi:MAG: hypothetical protein HUU35_16585, partial [Armatimonadetes bacterium]|nr:hypothetical protein [Armatimonadota bacterium]